MGSKHARQRGSPLPVIVVVLIIGLIFGLGFLTGHSVPQGHPQPTATAPAHHHHPTATPKPPAPLPAPHKPKPGHEHRAYTVHAGDNLWSIAGHVYHNPLEWHHLYHINHSVIGSNPNLIHIGTILQE